MILSSIIGSDARCKILVYLALNKKAFLGELEEKLDLQLFAVQTQLKHLEEGNVVAGWKEGHRKFFALNAEFPLYRELSVLLKKAAITPTVVVKPLLKTITKPSNKYINKIKKNPKPVAHPNAKKKL